jgi:hypothetical protein
MLLRFVVLLAVACMLLISHAGSSKELPEKFLASWVVSKTENVGFDEYLEKKGKFRFCSVNAL